MGCGFSRLQTPASIGTLEEVEMRNVIQQDYKPVKKLLDRGYHIFKIMQNVSTVEPVVRIWGSYVSNSSDSMNIFVGLLKKYPDVRCLFSSQKLLNRHTALVHKMFGNCLNHLIQGNIIDMGLALHSLGALHCQKGVTIPHLVTFEETCLSTILQGSDKAASSGDQRHQHQTNETIKDIVQIMIGFVHVGLQRNEDVMTYVRVVVEKRDDCWFRKKMEKKCHMKMAKQSWRKMNLHLSRL